MSTSFLLTFSKGGAPWTLLDATNDGGVIFQEPNPYERGFSFQFGVDSPGTEISWQTIREALGMADGTYKFSAIVDAGGLRLSGPADHDLPSGDYWIRPLFLEDETLANQATSFEVAPGGSDAHVNVAIKLDPRGVTLQLGNDPKIARVLDAPSALAGGTLRAFLNSAAVDARRKACALNLLAKLRCFPATTDPFIDLVRSVYEVKPDRVYANIDPALCTRLKQLYTGPNGIGQSEGAPVDAVHGELLENLPDPADAAVADDYTLLSYRANGRPSLQSVVAIPEDPNRGSYCDFDLDLADPLEDLDGFVVHMGEIASGKLTDHFALHDELAAESDSGPFIYYSVTNA
jgi:hypothetical protein